MQIIDATPQLVADILEEMKVSESKEKPSFIVRIGHHPTMGRIIVISGIKGDATIIQMI